MLAVERVEVRARRGGYPEVLGVDAGVPGDVERRVLPLGGELQLFGVPPGGLVLEGTGDVPGGVLSACLVPRVESGVEDVLGRVDAVLGLEVVEGLVPVGVERGRGVQA